MGIDKFLNALYSAIVRTENRLLEENDEREVHSIEMDPRTFHAVRVHMALSGHSTRLPNAFLDYPLICRMPAVRSLPDPGAEIVPEAVVDEFKVSIVVAERVDVTAKLPRI